jgi:hypothetical protein
MGLIERRINGADRRARELYLAPKGKKLWWRINPKTRAANELAPIEREVFLNLLIRVIEGNWAHARPGAGRRKRGYLQSPSSSKSNK